MRHVIFASLLIAASLSCLGEQSAVVLHPRPAAAVIVDERALGPNRAQEHEDALLRAQQRAVEQQEQDGGW